MADGFTNCGRFSGRVGSRRGSAMAAVLLACGVGLARDDETPPVLFGRDVMAVFSKAGCNAGACHGNQNGKGGFRLSLRGQDPAADYRSITREAFGRRVNLAAPEQSLLLRKPALQTPHEGGRRFSASSPEYRVLLAWLAAGAPPDPADAPRLESLTVEPRERVLVEPERQMQLNVSARFSDGSSRDVARWAVYEPADPLAMVDVAGLASFKSFGQTTVVVRYLGEQVPVSLAHVPARPDFRPNERRIANYIDRHVLDRLDALRTSAAPLASDGELLRRAYLDALGVLPTADEARRFVADPRTDKRARLIDELLARPEFAEFWALKWSDLLRNEEKVLDAKGVRLLHEWLRRSLAEDKPLDQMVRELVSAQGSTNANPPANYYRALREPFTRAEAAAQVLLGVRLQCARCHNHPFDRWTQDDYYHWAACFSGIDYKIVENRRKDDNDKHEFDGEQIVTLADKPGLDDPRGGRITQPRFLGAPATAEATGPERLAALANWLTAADNRLFARVQANRTWAHLMGRGIVEPIDDFRATNPPANPPLLEALADDFVQQRFDVRQLARTIMNSHAYQRSSLADENNRDDAMNFSHAIVRRLSAEQLLDATAQVLGVEQQFDGYPAGVRSAQVAGVRSARRRGQPESDADHFLKLFGKPPRLLACDCERSAESTLGQAFQLISGPTLAAMLARDDNRLAELLASGRSLSEMIDELYWSALCRPPTTEELAALAAKLEQAKDRRAVLEDIAWALVNSKEFLLRR